MDCIKGLKHIYTEQAYTAEHKIAVKKLMLAGALQMRSQFQFPGPVQEALMDALRCEELAKDWQEVEKYAKSRK